MDERAHADFVHNYPDSVTRWGSGALAAGGLALTLMVNTWEPFLAGLAAMVGWRYWKAVDELHHTARELDQSSDALAKCKEDLELLAGNGRSELDRTPSEEELAEKLERIGSQLAREREEHEELLLDIASGRAEVKPRGWSGVPLQPYLIVRHDEEERDNGENSVAE